MHIHDVPDDVLALVARGLPLKDRFTLSRASHRLLHASRTSPWWPRRLRAVLRHDLAPFTAWLHANAAALHATTDLRLLVLTEQLCTRKGHELPLSATYDGGSGFEALMHAVVSSMPRLDTLRIKVPVGTLFLHAG